MGTTLFGRIEIFLMGGADQSCDRMCRTKRHDVVDEFERQYLIHDYGLLRVVVSIQFNFQRKYVIHHRRFSRRTVE